MAGIIGLLLFQTGKEISRAVEQGSISAIAVPGTGVLVCGARGKHYERINGIFEATAEIVDKVTVYRRIDDSDVYLYYSKLSEQWRISDSTGRRRGKHFAFHVSLYGKCLPHKVFRGRPWHETVDQHNKTQYVRNDCITVHFVSASYVIEMRETIRLQGGMPGEATPVGVTAMVDPATGRTYYFDTETGESSWELPQPVVTSATIAGPPPVSTASIPTLPEGYTAHFCTTHRQTFYHHTSSGVSGWDFPTGLSAATSGSENGAVDADADVTAGPAAAEKGTTASASSSASASASASAAVASATAASASASASASAAGESADAYNVIRGAGCGSIGSDGNSSASSGRGVVGAEEATATDTSLPVASLVVKTAVYASVDI